MRVGSLDILPIHDGSARFVAKEFLRYTGTAADPWAPHQQFIVDDGELDFSLGGFLIRVGDRVVLIDAGVGVINKPPFIGGALVDSLRAVGVEPADITDVCFTHLHFDHVGWATQQGNIVFQNATFRCHRADWAHFVEGDDPGSVRKLAPIADRMEFWEKDGVLFPGITVTGAPGHTPGSTIFVINNGGEQAMLLGDAVHCPIELVEDDWEAVYDVDPVLARRTREALSREIEGRNIPVAAAHFPGLQFGRLLAGTPRRTFAY